MARDPGQQQRTDARRVPLGGSGKLDHDAPAPAAPSSEDRPDRPSPRAEDAAPARGETRLRLERERRAAVEMLQRLGVYQEQSGEDEREGTGNPVEEGDAAQASERRDLALMNRQRLAERISRLTTALERLEEGGYGTCEMCGEEIEPARLAALPEATTCLRCQEQREQRGAAA
jgi:DnaK suppressor protein